MGVLLLAFAAGEGIVLAEGAPPPHNAKSAPKPAAKPAACPGEMTLVGDACVDRYEAHLVRKKDDGTLAPHPPYLRPSPGVFVAKSEPGVRPQAYISRIEAESACDNAGKRLCSVTEWYRACRGADDTTYPYGAGFVAGRCNVGKPHLLSILHGSDPKAWLYDEHFNDPELDQRPGFLANTGEFAGCVSSYGVYDLVGNLHEWVSDRVDTSLATKLPLTEGIRGRLRANTGKGIFMGGFFSTTNQHGNGCNFVTMAHEPKYHDYSTGFRCCKTP
ncbi:MAG TPA: SUMF1/EgtB/PvdO family nonheme iron enzyme [Polyangiaceae bacterium]